MQCDKALTGGPSNQVVLMIKLSCACRECKSYPKAVMDCQLQCPGSSYSMDEGREELFEIKEEIGNSEMESDQWSSYSEGISHEETGINTHTCSQYCTVGHDELVIPKLHNNPLPIDYHTIVCTYCRETAKDYHHQDHPVRCSECSKDCTFSCERYLFPHKKAEQHCQECLLVTEHVDKQMQYYYSHSFVVNCTPVEASD